MAVQSALRLESRVSAAPLAFVPVTADWATASAVTSARKATMAIGGDPKVATFSEMASCIVWARLSTPTMFFFVVPKTARGWFEVLIESSFLHEDGQVRRPGGVEPLAATWTSPASSPVSVHRPDCLIHASRWNMFACLHEAAECIAFVDRGTRLARRSHRATGAGERQAPCPQPRAAGADRGPEADDRHAGATPQAVGSTTTGVGGPARAVLRQLLAPAIVRPARFAAARPAEANGPQAGRAAGA